MNAKPDNSRMQQTNSALVRVAAGPAARHREADKDLEALREKVDP